MKPRILAALLAAFVSVPLLAQQQQQQDTPGWILQIAYLDSETETIKVLTFGGDDSPKIFDTEKACQAVLTLQAEHIEAMSDTPQYVQRCHQINREDYPHQSTPLMRRDLKEQA